MITWDEYWKNYSISEAEKWMVEFRNKYFVKYIDKIIYDPKCILEVGCGAGNQIIMINKLRNDVECHALDLSPVSIEKVKKEIPNAYVGDCQDTKLPDNKFDMIFSAGLMEHFYDEVPFLNEMKRILKTDGYLITFVPAKYSLWQLYQLMHLGNWQHGYEKAYTDTDLIRLFSQNNFTIVDIIGMDPFSLNAVAMKFLGKRITPFAEKSIIKSGYTELGIVVKINK